MSNQLSDPTFYLNVVNPTDSGKTDDKVFIALTSLTTYLDFSTGTVKTVSSGDNVFAQTGVMQSLAALKTLAGTFSGSGPHPVSVKTNAAGVEYVSIYVPAMTSARIYFSADSAFPTSTSNSGPTASKGFNQLYDKVEFDTSTSGWYNVNSTSVDFYGVSYTISVIPSGGSDPAEVGYTQSRKTIIDQLTNIPATTPADSEFGNSDIFNQLAVSDTDNTYRVLAPKTMALSDWGATSPYTNARRFSHFLDEYVTKHCYLAGRSFSFYSKDYPTSSTVYYGVVDATGENINLYTDAGHTNAYSPCPTLPRPTNAFTDPSYPSKFHNVAGDNDTIDWGFLLLGNSAGTGVANHWGQDPLAMAIMVSICRGVMHLDDGTSTWIDTDKYYQGGRYTREADGTTKDNGAAAAVTSPEYPIFFYSKYLHELGVDGKAYVLSYDDVYGTNPTIYFDAAAEMTLSLNSLADVTS